MNISILYSEDDKIKRIKHGLFKIIIYEKLNKNKHSKNIYCFPLRKEK